MEKRIDIVLHGDTWHAMWSGTLSPGKSCIIIAVPSTQGGKPKASRHACRAASSLLPAVRRAGWGTGRVIRVREPQRGAGCPAAGYAGVMRLSGEFV